MFTLFCIAGYMLIVGGLLWGNHRWRLAQTPTPARVPFVDAEGTQWIPFLPPCPPPTRATESARDLVGYELDAQFFAVVAPSFREYR